MTSSAIRSDSLTGRSPDDGDESIEASIPILRSRTAVAASLRPENGQVAQPTQLRHQIEHDIRHQLSTVMLLAALLNSGDDVGPESRAWADQILGETRWLHQLMSALDDCLAERETAAPPMNTEPVHPPPGVLVKRTARTSYSAFWGGHLCSSVGWLVGLCVHLWFSC